MTEFASLAFPSEPTVQAPDGSDVRVLLGLRGGGMAHFQLAAGAVAKAVTHRTVGTHFQFRASASEPVSAAAVTMPPCPGEDEAVFAVGPWQSSAVLTMGAMWTPA